jgi:hypothetical protein
MIVNFSEGTSVHVVSHEEITISIEVIFTEVGNNHMKYTEYYC